VAGSRWRECRIEFIIGKQVERKNLPMKTITTYIATGILAIFMVGCETESGPDLKGEILLSSQTFGSDGFYILGYSYEGGEFYRFPFAGETVPDIINEGFRDVSGGVPIPGFNTPGRINGFALAEGFLTAEEALEYYNNYTEVEDGLSFQVVSDTVKLHQIWIQKTAEGNYVKLLVTDIRRFGGDGGSMNNEVTLKFTYQPDGSAQFGD
jgi:hypothetical protein